MSKIIIACILLLNISMFSQKKAWTSVHKKTSLKKVLLYLEKKHNVKFSFVDELIEHKNVVLPNEEKELRRILEFLEKKTHLKFEFTSKELVVVRNYNKNDRITICGYLLDEEGNPFNNLEFESLAIKTLENGYFEVNQLPYDTDVIIEGFGFRKRILNTKKYIKNGRCKKIYLIDTIEELDEVLIREYVAKGINLTNRKIQIKLRDLKILPGLTEPDILQSIQLSPGINAPFETASGLYVRGSSPHQNLVLWNGIKTYNQGHFFGILSAFNPYVAKEANFIKSGTSAKYGDRIAGVIDIRTEDKIASQITGGVGINLLNADATVTIPIIKDKLSVQLSGRRSYTDFLRTFTYNQLSKKVFQNTKIEEGEELDEGENDFFFADYNVNILGKISQKDELQFNAIYTTNDLDFELNNDEVQVTDKLKTDSEGINFLWKRKWNDKLNFNLKGYYSKYLLKYSFETVEDIDVEINSKLNRIRDYGIELDLEYNFDQNSKLLTGYHFSNNSIEYAFKSMTPSLDIVLDEDISQINTNSIFSELQYSIPNHIYVSLGFRFNRYSKIDKNYLEPRLFIRKNITRDLSIKGSVEFKSQIVNQIRESVISDLTLENQVWSLANAENFPAVTSAQVSLGSNYKKGTWSFDIDSYYKRIENITTLTSGFINPIDNGFHLGNSKIFGLDVFAKKRIEDYNTWISYSYINTQNRFEGINVDRYFPGNWNIQHTLKWTHYYEYKKFKFSLGWLWRTGKSITNVEGVVVEGRVPRLVYEDINGSNLPVYHKMDFSALYHFKINNNDKVKYQLGVSILNLYNNRNLLNREFRITSTLDSKFITRDIYAIGITPNISFRVFW